MIFKKINSVTKDELFFQDKPQKKTPPSKTHFNPGRFSSGLTEEWYPQGFGKGVALDLGQDDLVAWLRKKHADNEASVDLADRLEACEKNDRCLSAACIKCSHAAKAFATKVIQAFLEDHPEHHKIVCVSIVPADGMIAPGRLSAEQHARNVRRWKDALGRAGVSWFLGATDWSFNEHVDDRYEPSWQEHFYGFTLADHSDRLKKTLKEQFPSTDAIPRPVKIEAWDGDEKAVKYMLKTEYWRRIATDDGERVKKGSMGKRDCRATDKQPLRSAQKNELLLHLDEIGLSSRFLMKQLQFVNLGSAGWTIVHRAPKSR